MKGMNMDKKNEYYRRQCLTAIRHSNKILESLKTVAEAYERDKVTLKRIKEKNKELKHLIKMYEKEFGDYPYSRSELKQIDFNNRLEFLHKLTFSTSGYLIGHNTKTFTVFDDYVEIEYDSLFTHNPEELEPFDSIEKSQFISDLKSLNLGEWKKTYSLIGLIAMDGVEWELELEYTDGSKKTRITGSNAYPYNYDELLKVLGMEDQYSWLTE